MDSSLTRVQSGFELGIWTAERSNHLTSTLPIKHPGYYNGPIQILQALGLPQCCNSTVARPSTKQARHRVTSLIETNALPLSLAATALCEKMLNTVNRSTNHGTHYYCIAHCSNINIIK